LPESFFVRPPNVKAGTFHVAQVEAATLSCSEKTDAGNEDQYHGLTRTGERLVCTDDDEIAAEVSTTSRQVATPAGAGISFYSLDEITNREQEIVGLLADAAQEVGLEPHWPASIQRFDEDGMGTTGELVIKATLATGPASTQTLSVPK
jgi:hypothetical protein